MKLIDDETLLEYLERFKKIHYEINGITQDTMITYFEGGLRSKMLYIELQLRKPETIGEVFNVARKVALTEGSLPGPHFQRKERYRETFSQDYKGKNRTPKTETPTSIKSRGDLVATFREKLKVRNSASE